MFLYAKLKVKDARRKHDFQFGGNHTKQWDSVCNQEKMEESSMLKKRMLIVLGMAAVLSASCVSATVWAEENAETQTESETETTDESVTENDSTEETGEEAAEADVAEEENPEIQEGYTTELEGCTKVVSWCKNGDNNIYGQFYYPADFDETKTYPVVIMSHGIGSTSQMVERAKWPEKAAQDGYVVYKIGRAHV